jgi:hypothetical protein
LQIPRHIPGESRDAGDRRRGEEDEEETEEELSRDEHR